MWIEGRPWRPGPWRQADGVAKVAASHNPVQADGSRVNVHTPLSIDVPQGLFPSRAPAARYRCTPTTINMGPGGEGWGLAFPFGDGTTRSPGLRSVNRNVGVCHGVSELSQAEQDARLIAWQQAPGADVAHPADSPGEHLMPFFFAYGAAGEGVIVRCLHKEYLGSLPMAAYEFQPLLLSTPPGPV